MPRAAEGSQPAADRAQFQDRQARSDLLQATIDEARLFAFPVHAGAAGRYVDRAARRAARLGLAHVLAIQELRAAHDAERERTSGLGRPILPHPASRGIRLAGLDAEGWPASHFGTESGRAGQKPPHRGRRRDECLQPATEKPRVAWVDYAKGFCIIMVVMMHSTLGTGKAMGGEGFLHEVVTFAKPFRMPDFFLIAGPLPRTDDHARLADVPRPQGRPFRLFLRPCGWRSRWS